MLRDCLNEAIAWMASGSGWSVSRCRSQNKRVFSGPHELQEAACRSCAWWRQICWGVAALDPHTWWQAGCHKRITGALALFDHVRSCALAYAFMAASWAHVGTSLVHLRWIPGGSLCHSSPGEGVQCCCNRVRFNPVLPWAHYVGHISPDGRVLGPPCRTPRPTNRIPGIRKGIPFPNVPE